MEDRNIRLSKVVSEFFCTSCQRRRWLNSDVVESSIDSHISYDQEQNRDDDTIETYNATITGSAVELYISPMLSCVGDIDLMFYYGDILAIPADFPPPTRLPPEFGSQVQLYEIIDSTYSGYVYLRHSYPLKFNGSNYSPTELHFSTYYRIHGHAANRNDIALHGPAATKKWLRKAPAEIQKRLITGSTHSMDIVECIRCLTWPQQASEWPRRKRTQGWPDAETVQSVLHAGCDVVPVAHRACRQNEWDHNTQWRLSFSRAEIVLLNNWMPAQQIVYHMLRCFMKTDRLTEITDSSGSNIVSNYHAKTIMLWACELVPRYQWTEPYLNVVRICTKMLRTLGLLIEREFCSNYFLWSCNLFDNPDISILHTANKIRFTTERWLTGWFIRNYLRKCAQFCPSAVLRLFDEARTKAQMKNAVSAIIHNNFKQASASSFTDFTNSQRAISAGGLVTRTFSMAAYVFYMREIMKCDDILIIFSLACVYLGSAFILTTDPLKDTLLDVLNAACLQSFHIGHSRNSEHSSVLWLSQAAKLMKVVVTNSRSTVQLIEIELSKAYLYRALRCKDSDNGSIYCLANVYLAVLYYTTGQYQMATDHCTIVTRSQDLYSKCSSHVVQGELLPKIDDDIDNVLGLAVFYQHVRTAALNYREQQRHRVNMFSTGVLANYLHMKCLSIQQRCQPTDLSADISPDRKQCLEIQDMSTADLLLLRLTSYAEPRGCTKILIYDRADPGRTIQHLDTSRLVDLLHQASIEHLTRVRQLESLYFDSVGATVTTDFEALHAYQHGQYQPCLSLSRENVRFLFNRHSSLSVIFAYPVFLQMLDSDLISLIGLVSLVNRRAREDKSLTTMSQLSVSLYLMTRCQMKLGDTVTSVALTLKFVELARRNGCGRLSVLDRLILTLTGREMRRYISANCSLRDYDTESEIV